MYRSQEYRAGTTSAYRAAADMLEAAKADPNWTAALEQSPGEGNGLSPAVILDVDETVLDNSEYQIGLIRNHTQYRDETWDRWIAGGMASAVPGGVEYVTRAKSLGISIIYITNRTCSRRPEGDLPCPQRQETLDNLRKLGYPELGPSDRILMKMERPDWNSEKSGRRREVCGDYRILQMIGDDLADFIPGAGAAAMGERQRLYESHSSMWGTRWFLLPNPSYGSWLRRLEDEPDPLAKSN